MQTILFGRVPDENMLDPSEYFNDSNGNPYYFQVTLDENDEAYLEDTCGRGLPIDPETLKDAAMALTMMSKFVEAKVEAQKAYDRTLDSYMSEVSQNVSDWNLIRA